MSTHSQSVTERLSEWAVTTTYDDLPASTVHAVKRSLVDSIGVTAGGSDHDAVERFFAAMAAFAPGDHAGGYTVVGRPAKLDMLWATTANGVMAHVLDFDDTILPTRCHISAPLLPALLAVSEKVGASGRELIAAFAVGFDVLARIAEAAYPDFALRGWHGTGVMGPPAVAAAVARLLGVDRQQMAHAFALGATQASGLLTPGDMAKSFNLGRAGANGVQAAFLAAQGFTGAPEVLDGGYLELLTDAVDRDQVVKDLGRQWSVERNGFKPYPCGFVAHAAIDGVLRLRGERVLDPDAVGAITLRVSPETLQLTGKREPATGLEGKFSVSHAAAAAYIDGSVGPDTFTDAAVREERYRRLAARVETVVEPSFAQDEAVVELAAPDGSQRVHVEHALGTEANPMTDEQLNDKFRMLAEPVYGDGVPLLLEVLWNLEEHAVSDLASALDLTD